MPSSNLIGFGTRRLEETISMRVYILRKSYLKKYSNKKRQIHSSTLNADWAHRKVISSFRVYTRPHRP